MEIVAFCCHNSLDNIKSIQKDTSVKVNLLPCSSKIEVGHLLSTFETGVDAVMVIGCQKGKCQFVDGSSLAKGRVLYTKRLLNEIGLGEEKIEFFTPANSEEFLEAAKLMREKIK